MLFLLSNFLLWRNPLQDGQQRYVKILHILWRDCKQSLQIVQKVAIERKKISKIEKTFFFMFFSKIFKVWMTTC